MSPRAELAHRRLCDSVWSSGAWPDTRANAAAKLCRVTPAAWPRVLSELQTVGWRVQGHSLVNRPVRRPWTEAEQRRAFYSQRASAGGKALWQGRERPPSPAPDQPSVLEPETPLNQKHASSKRDASRVRVRVRVKVRRGEVKGEEKKGEEKTSPDTVKAERLPFSPSARKSTGPDAEKRYLADVTAVMALASPMAAEQELANWGGWWRNRYRENPDKASRVLAEIRSMIREGRILANPGAAAVDLWGRLP